MMGWLGHKAIISQGRSVLPLDMAPSFLKFLPTTSVDLQASPDRKFLTSDPCIWIICHMPEHEKITGPWYTYIFLQKYLSFVHCMKELRTKSVYPSAKSLQSCATPEMAAYQVLPSLGFSRQEHWSGLPLPSPMHESEKWKLVTQSR